MLPGWVGRPRQVRGLFWEPAASEVVYATETANTYIKPLFVRIENTEVNAYPCLLYGHQVAGLINPLSIIRILPVLFTRSMILAPLIRGYANITFTEGRNITLRPSKVGRAG